MVILSLLVSFEAMMASDSPLRVVRYLPRRLTWEPLLSSGRMPLSCAHSISHAETFVFFVLGQRDDGRVTSEYAAFHKVPSRGALQSFVGDFTPGGGRFYLQILMP